MQRFIKYSAQMRMVNLAGQFQGTPNNNFSSSVEAPVLFNRVNQSLLKVTLNKPKALNSLDSEMIALIQNQLQNWEKDAQLRAVIINGNGGKAFCAGGDIKSLYDGRLKGDTKILEKFFRDEFTLDYRLSQMKPIQISVLDGIVMGGGVGISMHSPIKIATQNSMFAMPEAKIGFFTDVGGGYFLSRLRKNIGLYLALTGQRLKGKELVQVGVANFYVPREQLENLEKELETKLNKDSQIQQISEIINKFNENVEPKYNNEDLIDEIFGANNLEQIFKKLESNNSEFSQQTLKLLQAQNSISLRVIFEQLKRGKSLSLRDNFIMDYRISQRFMAKNDFFEGVRTVLIDKNDTPKWTYKSPSEVPESEVQSYFQPLTDVPELQI